MNPDQMAEFRRQHHIGDGAEWDKYAGLTLAPPVLDEFLAALPFAAKGTRRFISPMVELPEHLPLAITPRMSTQEGFGRVLADLARIGGPLFGERLLPIGTLYDPFISRGLDALNYACYQDARFMVVATPSGASVIPAGVPTTMKRAS